MGMQLRFEKKEEVINLINSLPEDRIAIVNFDGIIGISGKVRHVKKKRSKRMINKAKTIVLCEDDLVTMINLHKTIFTDLNKPIREDTIKSILLANVKNRQNVPK